MNNELQWNSVHIIQGSIVMVLVSYFFYPTRSKKFTRIFILGFLAQLLVFDLSRVMVFTDDNANSYLVRMLVELVVFTILCSVLKAILDFPSLIKLSFYLLIAVITYLFIFVLPSSNCIEQQSYILYQGCIKAFQNYETLKSNTLNIFIICISVFEAMSNGIEVYKKNKIKRNTECSQADVQEHK